MKTLGIEQAKLRRGGQVDGSSTMTSQQERFADLIDISLETATGFCNLKSVRARPLRESFQQFWTFVSPGWAMKFIDSW